MEPNHFDIIRFRNRFYNTKKTLARQTNFSRIELEGILYVYYKLSSFNGKQSKYITRLQLQQVIYSLDIINEFLIDRMITVFCENVSSYITPQIFVKSINLLFRGSLNDKIEFCFKVYDIKRDGMLTRDTIILLLKNSIMRQTKDEINEYVKDFADIIIKKIDMDHDGIISFNDYKTTVQETPDLIECFGHILPSSDELLYLKFITGNSLFDKV